MLKDWRFDERLASDRTEEWIVEDDHSHMCFLVTYHGEGGQQCAVLPYGSPSIRLRLGGFTQVRNSREMRYLLKDQNPEALADYIDCLDTTTLSFLWLLAYGQEYMEDRMQHPERPHCYGYNVQWIIYKLCQ